MLKQLKLININDNLVDKVNIGLAGFVFVLLISVLALSVMEAKSVDELLGLNSQAPDFLPEFKLVKKSIKYYERILGRRALFVAQPGAAKKKIQSAAILDNVVSSIELELQGIISGPQGPQAILSNLQSGQSFYCSGGEAINGYKVKEVLSNKVILEHDGEILEMKL